MDKSIQKQIKAIKLAISSLERERRTKYAAGNVAYLSGIRSSSMKGEYTGELFQWVEDDHKSYQEYSDAISQLEDLIEVLEDTSVPVKRLKVKAPELFDESLYLQQKETPYVR